MYTDTVLYTWELLAWVLWRREEPIPQASAHSSRYDTTYEIYQGPGRTATLVYQIYVEVGGRADIFDPEMTRMWDVGRGKS